MELIFHDKFSLYDAAIFLHKVSSFCISIHHL